MHDYAVFIGRFQPFHKGHLKNIKFALSLAKKLIVIIGGYRAAPSLTDPWTAYERKKMILSVLTKSEIKKIQFIFIRDRLYNEELWKENVIKAVQCLTLNNTDIAIIGHLKDSSSYYLKIFPTWQFIETECISNINGTDFRQKYFSDTLTPYEILPKQVAHFVKNFKNKKLFKFLKNEYDAILNNNSYKEQSFVFILFGAYLLLDKRNDFPGKNLYSLPAIESLPVEAISTQYCVLKRTFYSPKFDASNKNGKTVLFYHIPNHVPFDMKKYMNEKHTWILLDDFYLIENKIFADHYQIICTLMEYKAGFRGQVAG